MISECGFGPWLSWRLAALSGLLEAPRPQKPLLQRAARAAGDGGGGEAGNVCFAHLLQVTTCCSLDPAQHHRYGLKSHRALQGLFPLLRAHTPGPLASSGGMRGLRALCTRLKPNQSLLKQDNKILAVSSDPNGSCSAECVGLSPCAASNARECQQQPQDQPAQLQPSCSGSTRNG